MSYLITKRIPVWQLVAFLYKANNNTLCGGYVWSFVCDTVQAPKPLDTFLK